MGTSTRLFESAMGTIGTLLYGHWHQLFESAIGTPLAQLSLAPHGHVGHRHIIFLRTIGTPMGTWASLLGSIL